MLNTLQNSKHPICRKGYERVGEKNNAMKSVFKFLLITIIFISAACNKGLYFDQASYDRGNNIVTEAKTLIGKATESYSTHEAEVATLKTHISDAVAAETARGSKSNAASINMWKSLQADNSFLNQAFADWKSKDKLNSEIIAEYQKRVDAIIGIIPQYENFKIKK